MQNSDKARPVAPLIIGGFLLTVIAFIFAPQVFSIALIAGAFIISQAADNHARSHPNKNMTPTSLRRRVLVGVSMTCFVLSIGLAFVSAQLMYSVLFACAVIFLSAVFWPNQS